MRAKESTFYFFILCLSFFSLSCEKAANSDVNPEAGLPILTEQNVSRNGCLNLEALRTVLSPNTPALEVVTDFVPDPKLNQTKALFHTYAAFDVKNTTTSEIFFLKNPIQNDCATILSMTASGEYLKYKITKSSLDSIYFELTGAEESNLPAYRSESLEKKLQAFKFHIQIITNTHFRVAITYRSFDAHCRSKFQPVSNIYKDYYWSQFGEPLPTEVKVSKNFYSQFTSTLVPEATISQPVNEDLPILFPEPIPLSDESNHFISVSISELKGLKTRALREEFIKCSSL